MRPSLSIPCWFVVALTALLLVSPVHAQTTNTLNLPEITCTSTGQLCLPTFSTTVQTSGTLQVLYTASPGHCSTLRVHLSVDGVEKAVSAFLPPGASSALFNVGPVSSGQHTLTVQAEGTPGGCNEGRLAAWTGTLDVTTSPLSATPTATPVIPELPPLALFASGLLLLGALAYRTRR